MVCCIVVLSLSPWCSVMYSISASHLREIASLFSSFLATYYASVREGVCPFFKMLHLKFFLFSYSALALGCPISIFLSPFFSKTYLGN